MTVVGVIVIFKEESNILKLRIHLRVTRIHHELKGDASMCEVHPFVGVAIGGREVRDAFIAHACTPERQIHALVIKFYNLAVYVPCILKVVAITARPEYTI